MVFEQGLHCLYTRISMQNTIKMKISPPEIPIKIWKRICPSTVKILKFGTPQTIAIIVLKIEKFDVTLH